jgi:N-acetylneuraminic acid mutarotase
MNQQHTRPMTLALSLLFLSSCSETTTEPEATAVPTETPQFAVGSNSWVTRADMPSTTRDRLATAVVTNRGQSTLYAIGGATSSGGSLGRVQAYNVATNTWKWRAELPIAVYNTNGAAEINGKIYISGGVTRDKFFRRELYMFDPATNKWTRKRDMPEVTWGGLTAVLNGQLYVLTCELEDDCYIDFAPLSLYRYDPATDQWTLLGNSPPQTRRPMGGFMGRKLYFTGDNSPRSGEGGLFTAYDPATNTWTRKTPMPAPRFNGAGVTLGGKLYVIGGLQRNPDGSISQVRTTSVYNPNTDTWSNVKPMPDLRSGFSASLVFLDRKPRIEVVGGPRPGNNLQYVP